MAILLFLFQNLQPADDFLPGAIICLFLVAHTLQRNKKKTKGKIQKQKNTNNSQINTIGLFLVAPTLQGNENKTRGITKSKEYKQILDNYSSPRLVVDRMEELIVRLLQVESVWRQKESWSFMHLLCSGMVGFEVLL